VAASPAIHEQIRHDRQNAEKRESTKRGPTQTRDHCSNSAALLHEWTLPRSAGMPDAQTCEPSEADTEREGRGVLPFAPARRNKDRLGLGLLLDEPLPR
jgi:hypothetical protein